MSKYMGHSPSKENPNWQTLKDHVEGVTKLLCQHARFFNHPNADLDARWLGYMHDLGKYRVKFQKHRLGWNPDTQQPFKFPEEAVPHSDAGALALSVYLETNRVTGSELPFAVANHHGALRSVIHLEKRLSETDRAEIDELFNTACDELPELDALCNETPPQPTGLTGAARTLYTRMLLGALGGSGLKHVAGTDSAACGAVAVVSVFLSSACKSPHPCGGGCRLPSPGQLVRLVRVSLRALC